MSDRSGVPDGAPAILRDGLLSSTTRYPVTFLRKSSLSVVRPWALASKEERMSSRGRMGMVCVIAMEVYPVPALWLVMEALNHP